MDELEQVREYLFALGNTIARKHYPDRDSKWEMHRNDVVMMCAQIDNMVSGMVRVFPPGAKPPQNGSASD